MYTRQPYEPAADADRDAPLPPPDGFDSKTALARAPQQAQPLQPMPQSSETLRIETVPLQTDVVMAGAPSATSDGVASGPSSCVRDSGDRFSPPLPNTAHAVAPSGTGQKYIAPALGQGNAQTRTPNTTAMGSPGVMGISNTFHTAPELSPFAPSLTDGAGGSACANVRGWHSDTSEPFLSGLGSEEQFGPSSGLPVLRGQRGVCSAVGNSYAFDLSPGSRERIQTDAQGSRTSLMQQPSTGDAVCNSSFDTSTHSQSASASERRRGGLDSSQTRQTEAGLSPRGRTAAVFSSTLPVGVFTSTRLAMVDATATASAADGNRYAWDGGTPFSGAADPSVYGNGYVIGGYLRSPAGLFHSASEEEDSGGYAEADGLHTREGPSHDPDGASVSDSAEQPYLTSETLQRLVARATALHASSDAASSSSDGNLSDNDAATHVVSNGNESDISTPTSAANGPGQSPRLVVGSAAVEPILATFRSAILHVDSAGAQAAADSTTLPDVASVSEGRLGLGFSRSGGVPLAATGSSTTLQESYSTGNANNSSASRLTAYTAGSSLLGSAALTNVGSLTLEMSTVSPPPWGSSASTLAGHSSGTFERLTSAALAQSERSTAATSSGGGRGGDGQSDRDGQSATSGTPEKTLACPVVSTGRPAPSKELARSARVYLPGDDILNLDDRHHDGRGSDGEDDGSAVRYAATLPNMGPLGLQPHDTPTAAPADLPAGGPRADEAEPPSPSTWACAETAGADDYLTVVDPQRRKVKVPLCDIESTKALNGRHTAPSLCLLFQAGRCRQGANCFQVHANPEVVRRLRHEAEQLPCCCEVHGDANSVLWKEEAARDVADDERVGAAKSLLDAREREKHTLLHFLQTQRSQCALCLAVPASVCGYGSGGSSTEDGEGGERVVRVDLPHTAFTIGLYRLVHAHFVAASVASAEVESRQASPQPDFGKRSFTSEESGSLTSPNRSTSPVSTSAHARTSPAPVLSSIPVSLTSLCRLHCQKEGCRFGADCKFIHLCHELLRGELAGVAAYAAASAATQTPSSVAVCLSPPAAAVRESFTYSTPVSTPLRVLSSGGPARVSRGGEAAINLNATYPYLSTQPVAAVVPASHVGVVPVSVHAWPSTTLTGSWTSFPSTTTSPSLGNTINGPMATVQPQGSQSSGTVSPQRPRVNTSNGGSLNSTFVSGASGSPGMFATSPGMVALGSGHDTVPAAYPGRFSPPAASHTVLADGGNSALAVQQPQGTFYFIGQRPSSQSQTSLPLSQQPSSLSSSPALQPQRPPMQDTRATRAPTPPFTDHPSARYSNQRPSVVIGKAAHSPSIGNLSAPSMSRALVGELPVRSDAVAADRAVCTSTAYSQNRYAGPVAGPAPAGVGMAGGPNVALNGYVISSVNLDGSIVLVPVNCTIAPPHPSP